MRGLPKLAFWILGLTGVALWTALIMALAHLPLPVELALGGMGLVTCFWGHAVLFPTERATIAAAAPGRMAREDMLQSVASRPLPVGAARTLATRRPRDPALLGRPVADNDMPPGDLPPLLRSPFEEAARMEARRLAEAVTATGIFGPVTVTLEPDGNAIVAPVQAERGVRVPALTLLRFAMLATQPDGLAPGSAPIANRVGQGSWPGEDLRAALDAHILAATGEAPTPIPPAALPTLPAPAWAAPQGAQPRTA
ncbi:hypothetical protein [Falsiroseomonas ponticola]|uniref:hypothetical protein n=1 Tax=Falsiroseomonas ponticola TaxID=2786951 RepID=UPI001933931F|nr:hypothetical protein [Roseomonas ponticola]